MEQRVVRLEERVDKLEEKFEKHGVEFAETRVYVKEIYKKLDDLSVNIASIKQKGSEDDSNNDRWAKIVERSFWAIVTIVGYFLGKGT
ncbi:hypothetical protein [Aneurinibacillus aneurinilyticus]|uniref:hypothetical protein n=1 Tax=Aneurinibacillus aneurinilyticus TaxID=1391 RepID=UPI00367161D5